jgi:hypothetical protein
MGKSFRNIAKAMDEVNSPVRQALTVNFAQRPILQA